MCQATVLCAGKPVTSKTESLPPGLIFWREIDSVQSYTLMSNTVEKNKLW